MKKDKQYNFIIPIYNCRIRYIISKDFIKTSKRLGDKIHQDHEDDLGVAFRLKDDCAEIVILIKPESSKDWSVIAHEVLHAVNFILYDRGVGSTLKNDEAQAYLLSYIINKVKLTHK